MLTEVVRLTAWEARERRRNKAKADAPGLVSLEVKTQQQAEEAEQTVLDRAPAVFIPGIGSELSPPPPQWLAKEESTSSNPSRFSTNITASLASGLSVQSNRVPIGPGPSITLQRTAQRLHPASAPLRHT